MSVGTAPGRLDWRSGGWVLALALVLVLAVVVWLGGPLLRSSSHAVGDGRRVESYGFDLDPLLVPRHLVVAAGFPKDGIPALVDPPAMRGDAVAAFNERVRGKYLVSGDRVIGVSLGGRERAYPLRLLDWHEVINDELGGIPIAVTYHPLCDSAVVFDRRAGGEVLELGVSGLLYDSNQLLFDRRPGGRGESLWSQLLARAVAGPAARAGLALEVLPASLARWEDWLAAHPETSVLEPRPDRIPIYERDPYGNYRMRGEPRFPVEPLPPAGGPPAMRPLVAIDRGGEPWVRFVDDPPGAGADGWNEPFPGVRVRISGGGSVLVEAASGARVFYSAWFAWHAQHPETRIEP